MTDDEREVLLRELQGHIENLHTMKQLRAWATEENQAIKRRMREIVAALLGEKP